MIDQIQAREDIAHWRARAEKNESQKNTWIALSFFMGLFLVFQFYTWATTPDKIWEVGPDHSYIVFHYQLWAHKQDTRYIWGKNEDGDWSWITIDEKGRPTGGYLSDTDTTSDSEGMP